MKKVSNTLINSIVYTSLSVLFLGNAVFAQTEIYDEAYYSPSKNGNITENYKAIDQYRDTTESSVIENINVELIGEPQQTKNTVVETTYSSDDYYDYEYTARLKRFYTPTIGVGYYDDYYTNLYWYTYEPSNWGISVYLGYNWWYPTWYYRPYYYGYYGWGGYWNPFAWNYSYYYGYPHYHHHHYHNHYAWNCYNYYNSFDRGSYYYGPRDYIGATSRYSAGRNAYTSNRYSASGSRGNQSSFGQRYEATSGTRVAGRMSTDRGSFSMNRDLSGRVSSGTATTSRRGGVDINRGEFRTSTNRNRVSSSSGYPNVESRNTNHNTTISTGNRNSSVSGSQRYSKPSNIVNSRNEQYTRPSRTNSYKENVSTSTATTRPSSNYSNPMNNYRSNRVDSERSAPGYNTSINTQRNSNTTGTINHNPSNNTRSSGTSVRSSSSPSRTSTPSSSGSMRSSGSSPSQSSGVRSGRR